MLLTTTPTIEGHPIGRYLGVVSGEAILGANIVRDVFAAVRNVVGGRAGAYENVLQSARDTALAEMTAAAQRLGANAVVGIDLDYETLGDGGSMLMVCASGTAVRITPDPAP